MIIVNVVLGLLVMVTGALLLLKTESFLDNFGRLPFFENHLATSGGSRLGYKLVGIIFLIVGFMITTGLISSFIWWMISPLTQYSQPLQ